MQLTMPAVKPGKSINAVINLELKTNSKGEIQIIGKTNLPDDMNLLVDLRNSSINYLGLRNWAAAKILRDFKGSLYL